MFNNTGQLLCLCLQRSSSQTSFALLDFTNVELFQHHQSNFSCTALAWPPTNFHYFSFCWYVLWLCFRYHCVSLWTCFYSIDLFHKWEFKKVCVPPIRIVKSNVMNVGPSSEEDKGPTLKTLDFTVRIGSTPTFLYFNLYLNTAYAGHYICFHKWLILHGNEACMFFSNKWPPPRKRLLDFVQRFAPKEAFAWFCPTFFLQGIVCLILSNVLPQFLFTVFRKLLRK